MEAVEWIVFIWVFCLCVYVCPFLLELEELFQDVTSTLTRDKFFIIFKEQKKQFFLKMDNRTCNSVSTDWPPSWVSSLGKMALNFSHIANYWWDNPQEIWRTGDKTLKTSAVYTCKVGPEIPLETDSARSLQYFPSVPLFRTEGPWKNLLRLMLRVLPQWTRVGRRWEVNFYFQTWRQVWFLLLWLEPL